MNYDELLPDITYQILEHVKKNCSHWRDTQLILSFSSPGNPSIS